MMIKMYNKMISRLRKLFAKRFLLYIVQTTFITDIFYAFCYAYVNYNGMYYLERTQFRAQ